MFNQSPGAASRAALTLLLASIVLAGCEPSTPTPPATPQPAVAPATASTALASRPAKKSQKPKRKRRKRARAQRRDTDGFDPAKLRAAENRYADQGYLGREDDPSGKLVIFSPTIQSLVPDPESLYVLAQQGECAIVTGGTAVRRVDVLRPRVTIGVEVLDGPYEGYRGWTPFVDAFHTRRAGE